MAAPPSEMQSLTLYHNANSTTPNNVLELTLPSPIRLDNYVVGVSGLYIYNSWNNVLAQYANNVLSYTWPDGGTSIVTFPDGFYSIENLNGYLDFTMASNGHYLVNADGGNVYYLSIVLNTVYYRYTLQATPLPVSLPAGWSNPNSVTLTGTSPRLIVPSTTSADGLTSMASLIGFAPGTYPPSPASSIYQVNGAHAPQISPVTSVSINCNCVYSSFFSASPQSVYSFSSDVPFGSLISLHPNPIIFFRVADGQYSRLTITLVDQDNRPVPVIDPVASVQLYFRKRGT